MLIRIKQLVKFLSNEAQIVELTQYLPQHQFRKNIIFRILFCYLHTLSTFITQYQVRSHSPLQPSHGSDITFFIFHSLEVNHLVQPTLTGRKLYKGINIKRQGSSRTLSESAYHNCHSYSILSFSVVLPVSTIPS